METGSGIRGKPHWQVLYVIGTNLAIIQTNMTNLPQRLELFEDGSPKDDPTR